MELDWTKFVNDTKNIYLYTARRMNMTREEAEDLVQEVYLKLCQKDYKPVKEGYSVEDTYRVIGHTILRHEAINRHRHMNRSKNNRYLTISEADLIKTDLGWLADRYYMDYFSNSTWEEIKSKLNPYQFSVITARATGSTYAEIAEMHGISLSSTKSVIFRTRAIISEMHLDI